MSPETVIQLIQFGAIGLLAFVLYFGLQHNAQMLAILARSLEQCQTDNHDLQVKIIALLEKMDVDLTPGL